MYNVSANIAQYPYMPISYLNQVTVFLIPYSTLGENGDGHLYLNCCQDSYYILVFTDHFW